MAEGLGLSDDSFRRFEETSVEGAYPKVTEAWAEQANCLGVDPDLFFPERGADVEAAKAICQLCLVKQECLEYALDTGQKHGIWGGMTERERRRIRRQRALESKFPEHPPE